MGKLEQSVPKPAHLEGRIREELSEAEARELGEWERACRSLAIYHCKIEFYGCSEPQKPAGPCR